MTPTDSPATKRPPHAVASESPSTALPFEYEDRTDGRHQRRIQEILAARAWTRHQRAQGFAPN